MLMAAVVTCATLADSTRAFAGRPTTANFVYEIWYEIDPDKARQFDEYLLRLREAGPQIAGDPVRWVDAHPLHNTRIVSLPAVRLADYRSDRYNEAGLRSMFGDDAYTTLLKGYTDAQVSRRSYIREYRTQLSLNRDRHTRDGIWGTEYSLVTVEPGRERQFERLWQQALTAYSRVSPLTVIIGARTLVGGGAQDVLARSLESVADLERVPTPARAVEQASGLAASEAFTAGLNESVTKWEPLVLERTELGTDGTGSWPRIR